MKKALNKESISTVPANPDLWSKESKQSYSYNYIKEYNDIEYTCWHCRNKAVFTAKDQKYTYEEKKAYIDQRRILCNDCWKESNNIAKKIKQCEEKWAEAKATLRNDKSFVTTWLELLVLKDKYAPYKPNTAAINMLKKILSKNA